MTETPKRKRSLGERIDSAITTLSPRWGMKRQQYRAAARLMQRANSRLGAYRGARKDRTRKEWLPGGGSADYDILPDLPDLRERSRDLNRNDGVAAGITLTMGVHTVGTGILPQSRIDATALELDDEDASILQRSAERAFREWMPSASADGRDFVELENLIDRQILENGEAILIRRAKIRPGRQQRFCWLNVESDRLSTPSGFATKQNIRDGVEIDGDGEPVAYHIRKTHPGDGYYSLGTDFNEHERITAKDRFGTPNVMHLYHQVRAGQSRGVPFFAPVLDRFQELAGYLEAEVVAARIAACFGLLIEKADPAGAAAAAVAETNSSGQRIEELEPGLIEYLAAGDKVTQVNPARPGGNFDAFVMRLLRMIGGALGIPYELVLKDFSQTNYSSARAALLEATKYFKTRRDWLARKFCQPTYEMVLEEAWLQDRLDVPDFYGSKTAITRARWITTGVGGWVDPTKEVTAARDAIDAGLSTLSDENAEQGADWEETLEQRAREERKREELGLKASTAKPEAPESDAEEKPADDEPEDIDETGDDTSTDEPPEDTEDTP